MEATTKPLKSALSHSVFEWRETRHLNSRIMAVPNYGFKHKQGHGQQWQLITADVIPISWFSFFFQ